MTTKTKTPALLKTSNSKFGLPIGDIEEVNAQFPIDQPIFKISPLIGLLVKMMDFLGLKLSLTN